LLSYESIFIFYTNQIPSCERKSIFYFSQISKICSYSLLPKTSIWENEVNKFAAELLIEDDLEINLNNEIYFDVDDKIISELLDLKFKKNLKSKS